jgi:hypothetical protein
MRGKRDALCDARGVELCRGRSGKVGLWILAQTGGGERAAIRLDSPIDAGSPELRAAYASGRALLAEMFSGRGNVPEEIAYNAATHNAHSACRHWALPSRSARRAGTGHCSAQPKAGTGLALGTAVPGQRQALARTGNCSAKTL